MVASYVRLAETGELESRAVRAREVLRSCQLCPHACGVDRLSGQVGRCRTGARAIVSSYGPHFGEESVLVGRFGSGTIFFAHCNLACVFCQNADISHGGEGSEVGPESLGGMMMALARRGCHHINLVTPTHVLPQILEAVAWAAARGLNLPLVYNCGGYEAVDALRLLDGVVDIYMPDAKYADAEVGLRLSGARDYPVHLRAALAEMHRQVGDLVVGEDGVAERGLLVRHLVLPNGLSGADSVFRFLAGEVSRDTFVNVMGQYRPCHEAHRHAEIDRRPTAEELRGARDAARAVGLWRLDS
ncbi:MAG TPA: radical SAM protein [Armatimonadota bacterium]|nr:radical SAM protein [Armatimonadota bacterium]